MLIFTFKYHFSIKETIEEGFMLHKLEKLFDQKIRPSLKAHGGNIEIIDYDNDQLFVRLQGGCQGCSASKLTLKDGVEKIVRQHYPEIKSIVDLTDTNRVPNPICRVLRELLSERSNKTGHKTSHMK